MNKQAHTPGPWHVIRDTTNGGDWPEGCELCIDDVEGGNSERDYCLASVVHGDPDELEANAALIAAAPLMYEALRKIVADMDVGRLTVNRICGMEDRVSVFANCELARAAIAKSEGRQ